uniref:MADF domain-containing protein n=1 Tax=Anopheles stephensi TaxID=30069 RepID=A0A182YGP2_ANOST
MRHPRYYNKPVRRAALEMIVEDVRQERPETTMKEIVRKIQTLRTQFGQELTKIRRHAQKGSVYRPTVWWYQGLNFLQHHIKPRTGGNCSQSDIDSWKQEQDDSSSTYNVSIVRNGGSVSPSEHHGIDSGEEEVEYETEVHYEINSIDMKDMKALELKPIIPASSGALKREGRYVDRDDRKAARLSATVERDDPVSHRTELSPVPSTAEPAPNVVPAQGKATSGELKSFAWGSQMGSERHTSLGHFVGSQMSSLKDDYIYYETQSEILTIMNRGILRQLALDKKNNAKADQAVQETSREKKKSE